MNIYKKLLYVVATDEKASSPSRFKTICMYVKLSTLDLRVTHCSYLHTYVPQGPPEYKKKGKPVKYSSNGTGCEMGTRGGDVCNAESTVSLTQSMPMVRFFTSGENARTLRGSRIFHPGKSKTAWMIVGRLQLRGG